jgi:hypothetical protein
MTGQQKLLGIMKSIAGAALVLFGMFVLYENVAGAVTRLSHAFANGSEALGAFLAVVLTTSQAVRVYAADHQRFLPSLLQQMFVSSWPLLLVIFGTVLSKDGFADTSDQFQEQSTEPVDLLLVRRRDSSRTKPDRKTGR